MNDMYYGIVEGFFSEPLSPWTPNERKKTVSYIRQYAKNISTYFYCPKDDPYITHKWAELYPQDKLQELKSFITLCKLNNVDFIYGLNPSKNEFEQWKDIKTRIRKKIDQIVELGCTKICLLFDDIPLAYDVVDDSVDRNVREYDDLVSLVNEIYCDYTNILDDFLICAPDYVFTKKTPITNALKKLDKRIGVIWTGNAIFAKTVTLTDVQRVQNLLYPDVRLILWLNYPVNDCEQAVGTFNLGAFYSVKQEVIKKLAGIVVNPMREAYANFPFYSTFSEFIQKPTTYNRREAWSRALKQLSCSQEVQIIIQELSSPNCVDFKKYISVQKVLQRLLIAKESLQSGKNDFGTSFLTSIEQLFKDFENVQKIIRNIENGKKVSEALFLAWDWFPTKPYIARYIGEIYTIVQARLEIYSEYSNNTSNVKDYFDRVKHFKSKYVGKSKLSISPADSKIYLRTITRIISLEQAKFLSVLNNQSISVEKKVRYLLQRRRKNRFTT